MTYEQAIERYSYDPVNGILINNRSAPNAKKGCEAGTQGTVYRKVNYKGRCYNTHRVVWLIVYGSFPTNQIDHIDGNVLNNRISNLREVTFIDNCKNRKKPSDNTSGSIGVTWDSSRCKWQAKIGVGKRTVHLGRYFRKEDAIKARKEAEIKYGFHNNHGRG